MRIYDEKKYKFKFNVTQLFNYPQLMSDIQLDFQSTSIGLRIFRCIRNNSCTMTSKSFFIELFKFVLYAIFGIGVYVLFFSSQKVLIRNSFHQNIITNGGNSGKIFDKNIRGIFPPLIDETSKLINRWQIVLDGQERIDPSTNQTIQDRVSLEFEWDGKIHIFRSGCSGDLILTFSIHFSNIFIAQDMKRWQRPPPPPSFNMSEEEQREQQERQRQFQKHEQDLKCIRGPQNNNIIKKLTESSIWTVYRDNLFFLVERASKDHNSSTIAKQMNEMIVFDRIR